ncbi:uncharacterized protein LOC143183316 [Calliopsis andreniformis]|uniref:uncharacterized protein LOC143183316 n=1 Tax=Calliopsis andreniformis TaxID=337506 RepID=UPI003FCDAB5C
MMEVKKTRKGVRHTRRVSKPQMSSVPAIGLITENVLVPIRKSICIKKIGASRSNPSELKTERIKPQKCNENVMTPLLKQPSHFQEKKCTSKLQYSKQGKKLCESEKGKLSKKTSRLINKSSTFPFLSRFQKFVQRTEEKKENENLPFPSPAPNSHVSSLKPEAVTINKTSIESNTKNKKCDKKIDKKSTKKINHTISVISERKNSYKNEDDIISLASLRSLTDLQNFDWSSTDTVTTICDKDMRHLLRNNVPSIPIVLTVATTSTAVTTSSTKTDAYCCTGPSIVYCDPSLTKFDVTMTQTISNNRKHREELQFPVKWSESDISEPVQFTVFDLSTSDKLLGTSETNTIFGDNRNDVWPSKDIRYSWEDTDRSILLSLAKNPSRSYDKTEPVKNEYPCRIKYSWQVLGRGSQTSRTLLDSLTRENLEDESVHDCSIKYSWQIIGIATQTSKRDFSVSECRSLVSVLSPRANMIHQEVKENNTLPCTIWRNGKKFFVLNNQCTQTFAHKESQTNCIEIHVKSH